MALGGRDNVRNGLHPAKEESRITTEMERHEAQLFFTFLSLLRDIDRKLDLTLAQQQTILKRELTIMSAGITAQQALSDIQAEVAQTTTVSQSAIVLLDKLFAAVQQANGVDPAAVEAVVAQFKAQRDALAQAVATNTIAQAENGPQAGVSTPPAQA